MEDKSTPTDEKPQKQGRLARRVAIVAAALVVVVGIIVGYSFYSGDLAPTDAAAKYSGFNYLPEEEVTDYILLYREQMGLADSSDADWATFLAAYNLTPGRLRYSTIQQLVSDKLVQMKADELGLSASDEEIDASVDTLRNTLGLGDDKILQETLEAHGQTEEGLREVYRQAILKRLVLSSEVETPTPTEAQVKDFMRTFDAQLASPTVRHTYYLWLPADEEDGNRDTITHVQALRNSFANGNRTVDSFVAMVKAESSDAELVASGGSNGWDVDTSGYGNEYQEALEGLKKNDVSEVFREDGKCGFIWVSDECTLPVADTAISELDPAEVPESLWSYLNDSAAYQLWEQAGNEYLDQLLEDANVVYYPMPSDVPYNVDMSLADVQLEEVSSDGAASASSASDGASGEASADSSADGVGSETAPSAVSDGAADAGSSPQASS